MAAEPEIGGAPASELRAQVAVRNRILAIVLGFHGLYHLVGFSLCWRLAEIDRYRYDDVHPEAGTLAGRLVAVGWLAAAIGFLLVAVLLVRGDRRARHVAVASALVSLAVSIPSADAALAGIVVDVAVLIAVVVAGRQARRLARSDAPATRGRRPLPRPPAG